MSFLPTLITYLIFAVGTIAVFVPCVVLMFKRNFMQSIVRLVFVVVGMALALLIAKLISGSILLSTVGSIKAEGFDAQSIAAFFTGGSAGGQIAYGMAVAIVAPLIYWALFLLIELVFLIIYVILSATVLKKSTVLASNKGATRAVSVVANLLIAVLLAANIFIPVTALPYNSFKNVVTELKKDESMSEMLDDETFKTAYDAVDSVASNPFVVVYGGVNALPTYILTGFTVNNASYTVDGIAADVIATYQDVRTELNALIGENDFSSQNLSALADKLANHKQLDEVLGAVGKEMATAWANGEKYLGVIEKPQLTGDAAKAATVVFSVLKKDGTLSAKLQDAANLLSVTEAASSGDVKDVAEALDKETINSMFNAVDEDSADVLKEMIGDALGDDVTGAAIGEFAANAVDNLVELQKDESMTEEEKQQLLDTEAEKLSEIVTIAAKGAEMTPTDMSTLIIDVSGSKLIETEVVKDTVGDIVGQTIDKDSSFSDVAVGITDSIVDNLAKINSDKSLTAEQRQEKLEEEQDNLTEVITIVTAEKVTTEDVAKLVVTASKSEIVSDDVVKETANKVVAESISDEKVAEVATSITDGVVDNISKIAADDSMTKEQKNVALEAETKNIAEAIDIVKSGSIDQDQADRLKAIAADSKVIDEDALSKLLEENFGY